MRFSFSAFLALAALFLAAPVAARPVAGDASQSLDSIGGTPWLLTNGTLRLNASVPGDLITDLETAGVIGDPLFETVFRGNATSPAAKGGVVWDACTWNYSAAFSLAADVAAAVQVLLILDGVKMVADVSLNGVELGYTSDQFLRYEFDVTTAVSRAGINLLVVSFPTGADARNVERRWFAASGGWDWAPYSTTMSGGGLQNVTTFSKGVIKSVSLVGVSSAAITHVAPLVFYKGAYLSTPLSDTSHGDFSVDVVIHLSAPVAARGTLSASGAWGSTASLPVELPAGASNFSLSLTANDNAVALWWPAQTPELRGTQALYNISVTFTPSSGGAVVAASRRIGFRVFTLVTGNDTDPSTLAGKDGSGSFTMRFKVNGADIWSRGANVIPMEELEGRTSDGAHRALVQSAVDGGMNTLRIWGGGVFLVDSFYAAADELGVLLYHDLMYAGYYAGSHTPAETLTQDAELRYQVRRLSEHPSVVMYDACNECSGTGLYASFVMSTVVEEDPSRTPWPACPSKGWASGVDSLWGLPNGLPLVDAGSRRRAAAANATCAFVANEDYDTKSPGPLPSAPSTTPQECCELCAAQDGCAAASFDGKLCWMKTTVQAALPIFSQNRVGVWLAGSGPVPDPLPPPPPSGALRCAPQAGETHGPYEHGGGFKTRNSIEALQAFAIALPPNLPKPALTGVGCHGSFTSEFGAVSTPSFESIAPTLLPEHWALHSPPMFERNYAVDNFVVAASNATWPDAFNVTGEAPFKESLYFAMLAQALFLKGSIEAYRGANVWGVLIWQLNEIWPTGGWGTVEYGTAGFTPGQVSGGRWKPLHYWLRRFLFRDALVSASNFAQLLVRSDDAFAPLVGGTATVSVLHIPSARMTQLAALNVSLPRGAGATFFSCIDASVDVRTAPCPGWPALLAPVGCAMDGSDCVAVLELRDGSANLIAENFELLAQPFALALPPAATVVATIGAPSADGSVPVTLTANATALFVTLTTLAAGRFSDNSLFAVLPGETVVRFLPWGPLDAALLAESLRVEHLGGYLQGT